MIHIENRSASKKCENVKTWIFGRDKEERNQLTSALESAEWPALHIQTLEYFEEVVNSITPDLLIICSDVMGAFGTQLVTELRKSKKQFPILCIGKKINLDSCLTALEAGADDFVQVPFNNKEIISRARRIVAKMAKRYETNERVKSMYEIGNIHFNPVAQILKNKQGVNVTLTKGEVQMLQMLCQLKGTIVTREKLGKLTQTDADKSRTIDVRISKLKKKLEKLMPDEKIITTKRREGYAITENIQALQKAA